MKKIDEMKKAVKGTNKGYLYGIVLAALVSTSGGCSPDKQYDLRPTGVVPSAKGDVVVSEDNLGDTTLDIEARDFNAPKQESGDAYFIAWTKSGDTTVKLGTLNITDIGGELIATTNMKRFKVLITSETSSEVNHPAKAPILMSKLITVEPNRA
jgi:hypothetical protein